MWDGFINLYNVHSKTLYCGLITYLLEYCESAGYTVQLSGDVAITDKKIITTTDTIKKYIRNDLSISEVKVEFREYQLDAIKDAINYRRAVLLSPTASGKSFIQYVLIRMYQKLLPQDQKLLLLVPTTSLVNQMLTDFADYSSDDASWYALDECHPIMAGRDKDSGDKRIIISTWQSLYKLPKKYFHQFGFINNDECHLCAATSLTRINEAAINCKYRFGTTGTLKDAKTHHLTIEGLLGPVIRVAKTKDLIDQKYLADIEITMVRLIYSDSEKKALARKSYEEEKVYLQNHEKRLRFLANMGDYIEENTLLLFDRVEHGKSLYNALKSAKKPDELYYVDGQISADQREKIRGACEQPDKVVYVVASYGTFATGINIKNLHNIVFASSTKSPIRLLQSIGRGLRTHDKKSKCRIFDICDDLTHKSWVNYMVRHSKEREILYLKEDFHYNRIKVTL